MRKQSLSHADFLAIRRRAEGRSPVLVDAMVDRAAEVLVMNCRGRVAAYAWSGGKDSIALRAVAERAGVTECMMGMCNLEYPAFLRWVTDHMPERLEVVNTGLDLDWLRTNPGMLFPQDAETAARWFKLVQHTAQARFYKARGLDVLLLGRRREDGNFVGPGGVYTSGGITRLSPIADWTHEDVFAVLIHKGLPEPPFYEWPRGYRCGTHPWPARQWCAGEMAGWRELWSIDRSIVTRAAEAGIGRAGAFLEVA